VSWFRYMDNEIRLHRELPYSVEHAWTLLTEPTEMNKWSIMTVVAVEPGADERMDRPGALRAVVAGGPFRMKYREVVQHVDQPSYFEYQVYDGGALLRSHIGTIELMSGPCGGCRLTWTVRVEFINPVLSWLVRARLRKKLETSLDRAARGGIPISASLPSAAPTVRIMEGSLEPLRRVAEEALAEQRDLAARLTAANDPKQWFARLYAMGSEGILDYVDTGKIRHPDWVLRVIPNYHMHYIRHFHDYLADRPVEPAWHKAWSQCEKVDNVHPVRPIVSGLLFGIAAHLEVDLPPTLASVYLRNYRGTYDYREFLPDYLRLSTVFQRTSDRLIAEMPKSFKPWWLRASSHIAPELRQTLLAHRSYNVASARLESFRRGYALALKCMSEDVNPAPTVDSARVHQGD
jgi:hypothetical protein